MTNPDIVQQIRSVLNARDVDADGLIGDLTGAIRDLLDLHKPGEPWDAGECAACSGPEGDSWVLWPCPTIEIIIQHLIPTTGDQP